MVTLLCLQSAILLGILYLFFGAFPLVFGDNYDFTLSQVGLSFLGLFVGMILGTPSRSLHDRISTTDMAVTGILSDPIFWSRNYLRLVRKREARTGEIGVAEPEARLPPTIFGTQLCWIGLFGFAWTSYSFVPWIAPIIMSGVMGAG